MSLAVTRIAVTGRKVEQNYVPEPYTAEEWDVDWAYDVTGTIEFVTTQTNYAPSVRWYDSRGRLQNYFHILTWNEIPLIYKDVEQFLLRSAYELN